MRPSPDQLWGMMNCESPTGFRRQLATVADAFRLSIQSDKRSFLVALGLPVFQGVSRVGQLVVLKEIATVFLSNPAGEVDFLRLGPWLAVAVFISVLGLVTQNLQELAREVLTDRVANLSAVRMHKAIGGLGLIDFDQPEIHDRISRAEATANYRPTQIVRSVTMLATSLITLLFILGWLTYLQPLLLPMFAVAAVPVVWISSKVAKSRFDFLGMMTQLERRRRYLGRLLITRQTAAEIRAYQMGPYLSERYTELSHQRYAELKRLLRRQWRSMSLGQLSYTGMLVVGIGVMTGLYYVGLLAPASILTAAYAMFQVVTLLGGLGYPLRELTESNLFLQDQREFYAHIAETKAENAEGVEPGPLRELTLRGVSFSYPASAEPAVKDVDLSIRCGELIAFVGPNGSGKTTLAKILALLYPPTEGELAWNGHSLAELSVPAARDRISTVFQDFVTYQFSVAENVILGDTRRPPEDGSVDEALKAAGSKDGVDALEQGKETQIGPEFNGGISLSGGQAQRLAIARGFYRDRELLILDEPTSGLDAKSDSQLMSAIRSLMGGRTAVVVSHRFSNVKYADRIYVLREGRIVESGTHDELVHAGGLYAEMYHLQAGPYQDEVSETRPLTCLTD